MRSSRIGNAKAFLRRTEGKFTSCAVAVAVAALVVGGLGWAAVAQRQGQLDEAVARQGELTSAALDVYRGLADADAAALNAVLVDPQRAVPVRAGFREDIFDAADALRGAATRGVDERPREQVRTITDLLPEYSRLVETGWTNLHAGNPVGTSYLAQASHLVRNRMLPEANALRAEQTSALVAAQRAAGDTPWLTLGAGVATLVLLLWTQGFVYKRTRRKVNRGMAAATVLTVGALVWLSAGVAIAGSHGDDGADAVEHLVAPLAEARNLGREADGVEARILIFPKVGDIATLETKLSSIDTLLGSVGDAAEVAPAAAALRAWRDHDRPLLAQAQSDGQTPPVFQELAVMVTQVNADDGRTHAERLDRALTELIDKHTAKARESTNSARSALGRFDLVFPALMLAAAAAAVWGLRRRILEYYR
ncbi:hypothetical protein [Actinokineospora sp. HUAS TT18]|uniref:hypothetical protein n=1 Tax=Actinokineospora sp. HUAS TT18 TaxID=3447451 RepID=UPI003F51B40A